ncbi:hypothetical protein DMX11_21970 [Pseudomonas sp. LB-090624]|nr:hypothetical protein DMX11_21970 [Pseudomonas sp. LB-090624]
MAIALGFGGPRWVRRPLPLLAMKGGLVDVVIAIIRERSFPLATLTLRRTVAFGWLATQPIVI